jgi:hypothetical protein
MSDTYIYGPRGGVLKQIGQLPAGAVAQTDLSGLARAIGGGLPVTSSLGPGVPIGPAHPEERSPRWSDYMPGINVTITPRQGEQYSFATLFGIANSWDVAGLAILKREEEFVRNEPTIVPRPLPSLTQKEAEYRTDSLRDQIADATGWLYQPDGQTEYTGWMTKYLDDLFKGDCGTIFLRGNYGGGLAAAEVINGRTIKPVLDIWGKIAQVPPGTPRHLHVWSDSPEYGYGAGVASGMACQVCGAAPAFAQVVKGMSWGWYGSDEIIYQPRWPRGIPPYGHPPIEAILLSANRALRRQTLDLSWYTEGTIPAGYLRVPESWTIEQARGFVDAMDQLYAGNDALRSRVVPIPGGPNSGVERMMPEPKNEVEEYLLHVGLAAFAVSPMEMGFIRSSGGAGLGGKGVAEEQSDAGRQRQISLSRHIVRIVNRILAVGWSSDLVLSYPSLVEPKDRYLEAQTLHEYWMMGSVSSDWVAVNVLGLDPPGLGNTVVTASGQVVPVSAITAGLPPKPEPPTMAPTPSATPGVSTEGVVKALGAKHVEYTGDLAKVVHRYLLRSYPAADVEWVLDPAIKWTFEPDVPIDTINYARRPGGRNEEKVTAIAESVNSGASMDFVVLADFGEPKLRIADGFHRILGAEKAGKDAVPAMVASDVPEQYRETVMGPMQADSTSVEKARVELRKWRQKAIAAVKRGESAAVPFRSDVIDPAMSELIKEALGYAKTTAEVWDILGTPPPASSSMTTIPSITLDPKITVQPSPVDMTPVTKAMADGLADIRTAIAEQLPPTVNTAAPIVKVTPAAPVPAPVVKVDMAPMAKAMAQGFADLKDSLVQRPTRKTVERDRDGRIIEVREEMI